VGAVGEAARAGATAEAGAAVKAGAAGRLSNTGSDRVYQMEMTIGMTGTCLWTASACGWLCKPGSHWSLTSGQANSGQQPCD
jgi:hypothetical protein